MPEDGQNLAFCVGGWKWNLLTEKLLISVALSGYVCKHARIPYSIANKRLNLKMVPFSKNPHWVLLYSDSVRNLIIVNSWVLVLIQVSQNSAGYWKKPQPIADSWMCYQPTWLTTKSTKNKHQFKVSVQSTMNEKASSSMLKSLSLIYSSYI